MTDSMDEWDGGAIDGRDQYLADAPYWSNGDGETVNGTDPNATGQVTTENVPDPGDEPEIDDTDESETDEPEVPTWPPNPETLTELRRRLLNGESTHDVGEWVGVTDDTIRYAAKGDNHSDVGADIPPLNAERNGTHSEWVVDKAEAETETEPETERPDNGKWGGGIGTEQYLSDHPNWNGDGETVDATDSDPEAKSEIGATDAEEEPESGPGQQESGLVSGDERLVARDPPEPETPTVPTHWIVAGVAFVTGWILSRLVRGGDDE